jgi:hypothetical protein
MTRRGSGRASSLQQQTYGCCPKAVSSARQDRLDTGRFLHPVGRQLSRATQTPAFDRPAVIVSEPDALARNGWIPRERVGLRKAHRSIKFQAIPHKVLLCRMAPANPVNSLPSPVRYYQRNPFIRCLACQAVPAAKDGGSGKPGSGGEVVSPAGSFFGVCRSQDNDQAEGEYDDKAEAPSTLSRFRWAWPGVGNLDRLPNECGRDDASVGSLLAAPSPILCTVAGIPAPAGVGGDGSRGRSWPRRRGRGTVASPGTGSSHTRACSCSRSGTRTGTGTTTRAGTLTELLSAHSVRRRIEMRTCATQ